MLNSLNCDRMKSCEIQFKYKRLKNFYYYSAELDHKDKDRVMKTEDLRKEALSKKSRA